MIDADTIVEAAQADAARKRFATACARCALAGFILHQLAGGTFLIADAAGNTRDFLDLACVELWLSSIEGRKK